MKGNVVICEGIKECGMKVFHYKCTNPQCGQEGDQTVANRPYVFSTKCPKCGGHTLIEK